MPLDAYANVSRGIFNYSLDEYKNIKEFFKKLFIFLKKALKSLYTFKAFDFMHYRFGISTNFSLLPRKCSEK